MLGKVSDALWRFFSLLAGGILLPGAEGLLILLWISHFIGGAEIAGVKSPVVSLH